MYLVSDIYFYFFQQYGAPRVLHSFLHDALPIWSPHVDGHARDYTPERVSPPSRANTLTHLLASLRVIAAVTKSPSLRRVELALDRKSTRLNSSHSQISYAVFCLKKKTHIPELHK